MLSHWEAESVGGNHSRHNAKLLNQATEKERVRVKTAKEGNQKQHIVVSGTDNTFMQCHSYLRPFCRSNFAWQMFLLVLIEFELKLERPQICRIWQMVSMKTPNRTHQRLVMFFSFLHQNWEILRMRWFSCKMLFKYDVSLLFPRGWAGCALHQGRVQSKAGL